jgi:hypothetical protein
MGSFFIITILCIIIYLLVCYEFFSPDRQQTHGSNVKPQECDHRQTSDDDIMGKSTFDVNAELRKKREREEEQRRKDAIDKGEMTEDGKEIAQEVAVEDCEVEPKREWKQVPTEELDAMFDEPDEPGDPHAEGVIIDDIDLTFHTARKKNPTKEEIRKAAETLIKLEGTEFKDEICRLLPEAKNDIDRVMKMYSAELDGGETKPKHQVNKRQEKKPFPERFEDFSVEDLV